MTDYTDLIAQLRFFDTQIANSCADALETQAKRIAELSEAIGLLTTLKPDMEIDANSPVNMAAQIVAHVDARIAELEAESKARLTDASTAWDLCETLRARIAELEAALKPFAGMTQYCDDMSDSESHCVFVGDLRAARAALEKKK